MEEKKEPPASNAIEIDIRIRIGSWVLADAQRAFQEATKMLEAADKLRPLLEKAGAVAQIVAALRGIKP